MLLPEFYFNHAEEFVNILDQKKKSDRGLIFEKDVIIGWTNPIMVLALSIEILNSLTSQFRSLALRTNKLREELITYFTGVYTKFYYPEEVEVLFLINGQSFA